MGLNATLRMRQCVTSAISIGILVLTVLYDRTNTTEVLQQYSIFVQDVICL